MTVHVMVRAPHEETRNAVDPRYMTWSYAFRRTLVGKITPPCGGATSVVIDDHDADPP